ncbi:hypothetical protein QFZ63_004724 [Streptomyces sp. B3I7]|uniref:effector-associated constant component EACC1 n=1 Tax=Streptomyces sp. B3I7 TaxID=3042269 RepID=UPI0027839AE3|nr:hypothetical protein [Streptomyces sp. B3I7]MDQ0813010.1 hypothetical protein [Streptomyces sp. B3I7]
MRTDIRAGDGPATLDLYHWLRADPELRHRVTLRRGAPGRDAGDEPDPTSIPAPAPDEGAMGVVDVVDAVVVDTVAVLNLVLSCLAHRAARRCAGPVTFTRGGTSVTVRGESDEETLRIVLAVLAEPEASTPEASTPPASTPPAGDPETV